MGSNRLPGKSLLPFGQKSLLAHIVARMERGGVARSEICIATSVNAEDLPIIKAATELGCECYAGSPSDVSRRILGAAGDAEGFLLILGDNPWIDSDQIAELSKLVEKEGQLDYVVSSTQELPEARWPERLYPVGTRLQYIRTAFMAQQLDTLDSEEVREHTSKLFVDLPEGTSAQILCPEEGWSASELGGLNISINTAEDYNRALVVLERVGPNASCADATRAYFEMKGET